MSDKQNKITPEMQIKIDKLVEHANANSEITILSYGLGVESTAILLRWMLEPETRPCALDKLIVITSQVGNEWGDTGPAVERHILPLMRQHGIRFVQVARRGHQEADGITVLADTRSPEKCYMAGDYTLADELRSAGSLPQYSGTHICSLKFKAFVVESWLKENVRVPARHAFGYNVDEASRVEESEAAVVERIAFGFNKDEKKRIEEGQEYNTATRVGFYPLLEWNWSRQDCLDYIKKHLGITWRKSACVFCPFSKNKQSTPDLIARQKQFPEQVADAMVLERVSMSLNPNGVLYATGPLIELVIESDNTTALEDYHKRLASLEWAIYQSAAIGPAKPAQIGR